jgi:hypothetical protein
MIQSTSYVLSAALAVCGVSAANADMTVIAPFTGQASDTFDQFNNVNAVQSLPVFGGQGALENLSPSGAIKVEFSSLFQGHQVVPISDMMAGQLGVAQWVFNQPITRFGGWWENNSGQPDATVAFYDTQNVLLDTMTANVPFAGQGPSVWTWNGWESDVPISRIVVTGNGIVNGFLWYENMQVDFAVPGPSGLAFLILGGLLARRRREG